MLHNMHCANHTYQITPKRELIKFLHHNAHFLCLSLHGPRLLTIMYSALGLALQVPLCTNIHHPLQH